MKIPTASFTQMFGLMGVHASENRQARLAGRLLDGPMLLLAGWIIIDWYLQNINQQFGHSLISDWIVWIFFAIETLTLLYLVDDKKRYLSSNWVNLIIVIFSFPVIWQVFPHAAGLRVLRLVVLVSLFIHASRTLRHVLARNNLGRTLIASLVIIVISGTIISLIDPNVKNTSDGIWWAWVTVTTVGYGDIVPTSNAGRVFGAFLILMGLALITMLTASFAAFFMAEDEKLIRSEENLNTKKLALIEQRLQRLEEKLDVLINKEQAPPEAPDQTHKP